MYCLRKTFLIINTQLFNSTQFTNVGCTCCWSPGLEYWCLLRAASTVSPCSYRHWINVDVMESILTPDMKCSNITSENVLGRVVWCTFKLWQMKLRYEISYCSLHYLFSHWMAKFSAFFTFLVHGGHACVLCVIPVPRCGFSSFLSIVL